MALIDEGKKAPAFSLKDQDGKTHKLADYAGKPVVLYFYPKDDTPGCTVEACEFRDRNETIHERGADVWGVSPQGAASKRAFRQKFELPFTLLADDGHHVADEYGVWAEKKFRGRTYMGVERSTFVIDEAGNVKRVMHKVKPDTHADDVLETLRS